MKKKLAALHASLLLVFFAVAPLLAGDVEERIKALEEVQRTNAEELQRLKGEQMELKKEATTAAAALPEFVYRPGAGLSIRAADRSWQIRFRFPANINMGFFPQRDVRGDPAASEGALGGHTAGASQGTLHVRRIRPSMDYYWAEDFYHLHLTMRFDSDPPEALNMYLETDFTKLSPYYPGLFIGRVGQTYNPVTANYDGIADTTLERPLFVNDFFATTASMRIMLGWRDIPLAGPAVIESLALVYNPIRGGGVTDIDSSDRKGFVGSIQVQPFKLSKNKWVESLNVGLGYHFDQVEQDAAGGVATQGARDFRIRTTGNVNRKELFRPETSGQRHIFSPNVKWSPGPYRFGIAWDHALAERDFKRLGPGKLDDAEVTAWIVRNGLWIWGPKGFLTGSEAGGVLLAHTFNRADSDAGANFATRNSFSAFRRNTIILNQFVVKYLLARNMAYTFQWSMYDIAKMRGTGGTPTDTRRHLGIGQSGGTYNEITLDAQWRF